MNWKLPEALQKSVNYFKPGTKSNERPPSPLVDEEEDHLGIQHVDRPSPAPFRRIESSFHNYVEVALPVELDRLRLHQSNIKKWRKLKDSSRLQSEYEKSAITVKQIKTIISNIENLRAKVIEADHPIFDKRLSPVKTRSLVAIEKFVRMCNENDDGLFEAVNNDVSLFPNSTGKGDLRPPEHDNPSSSTASGISNVGFTHMRGNRLLIDSTDVGQSFRGPDFSNDLNVQNFGSENESFGGLMDQNQLELVVEKENTEIDESWKKLEKDMTELHEMMKTFSKVVYEQGETVDDISNNIEKAEENIQKGNVQLQRAKMVGAAMFPVLGAVVGGAVGGPIGAVAGFKLGSVTTGFAAAGITGTVLGYQGGKALKKRQEEPVEMKEIRKREESDSSDSFEFLENDRK